jgi:hypothetical protein
VHFFGQHPGDEQGVNLAFQLRIVARPSELKAAHSLDIRFRAGGDQLELILPLWGQESVSRREDVYDSDQVQLTDGGNDQQDNAQRRKIHAGLISGQLIGPADASPPAFVTHRPSYWTRRRKTRKHLREVVASRLALRE